MTYTHLTPNELVMIEAYYQENKLVSKIALSLRRSRQTIYNVINFLKTGKSASNYWENYQINKTRCDRRSTILSEEQRAYVQKGLFKDGRLM